MIQFYREFLSTYAANGRTTLSPRGFVETVPDNTSCSGFPRPRASPVWTAETLDSSDLVEGSSGGLELSCKLYHAGESQVGYQQLMPEALLGRQAPAVASTLRSFRMEVAHRFGSSQIAVIEAEGFELA